MQNINNLCLIKTINKFCLNDLLVKIKKIIDELTLLMKILLVDNDIYFVIQDSI